MISFGLGLLVLGGPSGLSCGYSLVFCINCRRLRCKFEPQNVKYCSWTRLSSMVAGRYSRAVEKGRSWGFRTKTFQPNSTALLNTHVIVPLNRH